MQAEISREKISAMETDQEFSRNDDECIVQVTTKDSESKIDETNSAAPQLDEEANQVDAVETKANENGKENCEPLMNEQSDQVDANDPVICNDALSESKSPVIESVINSDDFVDGRKTPNILEEASIEVSESETSPEKMTEMLLPNTDADIPIEQPYESSPEKSSSYAVDSETGENDIVTFSCVSAEGDDDESPVKNNLMDADDVDDVDDLEINAKSESEFERKQFHGAQNQRKQMSSDGVEVYELTDDDENEDDDTRDRHRNRRRYHDDEDEDDEDDYDNSSIGSERSMSGDETEEDKNMHDEEYDSDEPVIHSIDDSDDENGDYEAAPREGQQQRSRGRHEKSPQRQVSANRPVDQKVKFRQHMKKKLREKSASYFSRHFAIRRSIKWYVQIVHFAPAFVLLFLYCHFVLNFVWSLARFSHRRTTI